MRKGWRGLLVLGGILALGGCALKVQAKGLVEAATGGAERPVKLTVEVFWNSSVATNGENLSELEVEVSDGRVLGAVAVAEGKPGALAPQRKASGAWRLGAKRKGKARLWVEAPIGASLIFKEGGTPMRFPLAMVLEGAQRTPSAAPLKIQVERVPWDAIDVAFGSEPGQGGDGIVAPGAKVPMTLGFRLLTPEASEAAVQCSVVLRSARGGETVWRYDLNQNIPTNTPTPALFTLPLEAPTAEGTYALEVQAKWAPAPENGKLISRLIRRGKRVLFPSASASRKVTLAVLSTDDEKPKAAEKKPTKETEVDTVDLVRLWRQRAWGAGRAPVLAGSAGWVVPEEAITAATPKETATRDRVFGLIGRGGTEISQLGPVDAHGAAWSSLGMRVIHPGRPHKLTLTVTRGAPEDLEVALIGPGARPRRLLDARATGAVVQPDGPPVTSSWFVWPDSTDPVLVLVNRAAAGPLQLGTATLSELTELREPPMVETPVGAASRWLGLTLSDADGLDRFGATFDGGWTDAVGASRNFASYLGSCGATSAVVSERLADRERRCALAGNAAEDCTGPDRLDVALRVLQRHGIATWLELDLAGALPGLPDPSTPEALAKGLVRVDRHGAADGPVATYHPLADGVAAALTQRVTDTRKARPGVAGLLVKLGPGPTLLGGPETGFDDATFARFFRETFDAQTAQSVPGLMNTDASRFAARARFLAGPGRMPWLSWRAQRLSALYAGMAQAARAAAPGTRLAVTTPMPDDGPAGTEARRADLAGLAPGLAWRAVGLDLDTWPTGDDAPLVLRGVGLSSDDLSHDLATSPELDAKVVVRPSRGVWLDCGNTDSNVSGGLRLTATASEAGPEGDEPLSHALAALDAHAVCLAVGAVAGHEERLRRFARVFRALPAVPSAARSPSVFGVAVRTYPAGENTYLSLANDTPYPVRLDAVLAGPAEASVFDLGRDLKLKPGSDASGRHLVLDLPPFGVSALRVAAAGVAVSNVTPYPKEEVLTALHERYQDVNEQLTRLNRGLDRDPARAGPPNPDFEADAPHATTHQVPSEPVPLPLPTTPMPSPTPAATTPAGWQVVGGMGVAIALDAAQPHAGHASMRIDAATPPGSAVCEPFTPGVGSAFLIRSWLRADRPDARVRLWIEGESAGKSYRRVSELPVSNVWTDRTVRAGDIPTEGLDSLRLRFELLTPGSLWVDDLSLSSEGLSEPERRNALNALLAALQAYKEKRFADFVRLSGSRWTRRFGNALDSPPDRVASDRSGLIRTK